MEAMALSGQGLPGAGTGAGMKSTVAAAVGTHSSAVQGKQRIFKCFVSDT